MRSRTAGVMTTLMRNGRDRRLEKPVKCHARKERVFLVGTRSADHIRASGHSGCIQRPDTWLHPNASLKCQIPLAPRAPSIHGTFRTCCGSPPMVRCWGMNRPKSAAPEGRLLTPNGHQFSKTEDRPEVGCLDGQWTRNSRLPNQRSPRGRNGRWGRWRRVNDAIVVSQEVAGVGIIRRPRPF